MAEQDGSELYLQFTPYISIGRCQRNYIACLHRKIPISNCLSSFVMCMR